MKKKLLWITRTAIFIALLIVLQIITKSTHQIVTGSAVNMVLVVCALTAGLASGLTVAVISPFFAFFLGIGPKMFPIVPIIALGNAVIVLTVYLIAKKVRIEKLNEIVTGIIAVVAGAVLKFLVLFIGVVKIYMWLAKLPSTSPIAIMFSYPQLITALIGGIIALIISIPLNKIINPKK